MNCKKCGKALGTDIGACPFCGAMMTNEQLKIYVEDKKERNKRPELITEKYTGKPMKIERNETYQEKKLWGILLILGTLLILLIIVLLIV